MYVDYFVPNKMFLAGYFCKNGELIIDFVNK